MNSLKIMSWNANGLTQRKLELEVVLHHNSIDVCLISETHFTKESYLNVKGYKCYHALHPSNKARGGSAVLIKDALAHHQFTKVETEMFQIQAVKVKTRSWETTLASIYCPPKPTIKKEDFDNAFGRLGNRFIIGGDFNAKHSYWGSRLCAPRGTELYQYVQQNHCTPLSTGKPTYWPTDPAKKPDLIDFFLTKNISANYVLVEELYDLSSDHSPILLTLSEQIIQKTHSPVLVNNKTDWNAFKIEINKYINLNDSLDTPADIDLELEQLTHAIQTVAWECTPEVRRRKG